MDAKIEVPMPHDLLDVIANSIALVGELVAPMRPDCTSTNDLFMQLRERWHWDRQPQSGYPRLRFLTELDGDGMDRSVRDRVQALEQRVSETDELSVPMSRLLQRTVMEYLEETPGTFRDLGAGPGWVQRLKAPSVALLADVIWYLAWRGFIEISEESKVLRPLLEQLRGRGRPTGAPPREFVDSLRSGETQVRLTAAGGDHLFALQRERTTGTT
jgi:hypothetical protein